MKNSYVGIIGFGSQGKRIFSILKKLKFKNLVIFKINKFYKNKKLYTNNFSKIKKCDIVFVCSPNNTHFKYVKSLEKNIYIFCEKTKSLFIYMSGKIQGYKSYKKKI